MPSKSAIVLALIRTVLGLEALVALVQGVGSVVFVTLAALVLTFMPGPLAHRVGLSLPPSFLVAIALFVMASLYLGEVHDFYDRLWWWDLALHTGSAAGFGLLGFLLIFMLFKGDRYAAPPWAIGALSFCVAITVGTLWEVFEMVMDTAFGLNMTKSGLPDTMGDLIVNAVGAAVSAGAGVIYLSDTARSRLRAPFEAFIASNRKHFGRLLPRRKR